MLNEPQLLKTVHIILAILYTWHVHIHRSSCGITLDTLKILYVKRYMQIRLVCLVREVHYCCFTVHTIVQMKLYIITENAPATPHTNIFYCIYFLYMYYHGDGYFLWTYVLVLS